MQNSRGTEEKHVAAEEILSANMLHDFNVKERSVNFSKEEVTKLQVLVEKYKNILMCKKTDGTSTKQKEKVWYKIETEFNATGQIPRTVKQLKYKFENMKRSSKKEASRERQEMRRTGGGKPPSVPPASEDTTDWLRSMMSTSINGNEAVYDDDVLSPTSISTPKLESTRNVIISMDNINEDSNLSQNAEIDVIKSSDIISERSFDCSTPHSSLRKPIAPPLKKLIKKKNDTSINDNGIKRALREQKISVLQDLNGIEMDRIKQNIRNQNELHQQLMRQNEEKHKLELRKLELEIEILHIKKENMFKET